MTPERLRAADVEIVRQTDRGLTVRIGQDRTKS